jgi:hypothetical protein
MQATAKKIVNMFAESVVPEVVKATEPDSEAVTDMLGDTEEPEMTEEEKEARRARERFLSEFQGDSMFLDDLAGAPPSARKNGGAGESGGLIHVGSSDAEEGDVDFNEQNLRKGSAMPRNKFKPKGSSAEEVQAEALGPPGSVPLGKVQLSTEASISLYNG